MNRLTKRDGKYMDCLCENCEAKNQDFCDCGFEVWARLKQYEDMEEQGLLVRLPCKVGDRMYFLDTCHTAEDFGKKFVSWGEVTKVSIAGMYVCLKTLTGLPLALSWESIFTTREAAEKALEEACRKNT